MKLSFLLAGVAVLAIATPAAAHHSFAVFDSTKTVAIKGVVKEFQWTNPHVWLQVKVAEGKDAKDYAFEGGAIAVLKRFGWTRDTLKPGDVVTINTHPFRNGNLGGSLEQVTLPNGKTLSAGNGVPGALVVGGGR